MAINLQFTNRDIQNALESKFGIDLSEQEVSDFLQSHQNQIEERISELSWEVIEDLFDSELPKYNYQIT